MARRKLLMTLCMAAALALPVAPALAAGHGGEGHGGHHAGRSLRHGYHHGHRGGKHGGSLLQLEGTVVSVAPDGSSIVLQPWGHDAMTVTVAISTSTVVTAAAGLPTTLAAGERVHVAGSEGADGTYTAVRVVIQRSDPEAAGTPEADTHAGDNATWTPDTDAGDDATPTPSS